MRYNLACALSKLRDIDRACELLEPYFAKATGSELRHARVDPDLDPLRADPRFEAMLTATEVRVAAPG